MLTTFDICERLKKLPEIDLLEILELTSEDIVNRFEDVILERIDYLEEEMEDGR